MSSTSVSNLRCEYQPEPLGIDVERPRMSWQLQTDRRGARQAAYQVLVSSTEALLAGNNGDLWDPGRVDSDQSVHVPYGGRKLESAERAWWKVRVWDETGAVSDYSGAAWWETGLLDRSVWVGDWIGGALEGGPQTAAPCPFLRRSFLLERPVASARLYATGLGLYECYVNGEKSAAVFTPGWTDYRKRVQYQTYDVTPLLRNGENVLGAVLGDGWYCGHVGWRERQYYGDRPRFLAQLVLRFADGEMMVIPTDSSWKTAYGPILEADLLMGESFDARQDLGAWSEPGYDDAGWLPAADLGSDRQLASGGTVPAAIVASPGPSVRRIQELKPVGDPRELPGWPSAKWIFDLGQNMVGRIRLKVSGDRGTTITLRHAEVLNPDGTLYTTNLRSAKQTDHYTLSGKGEEIWEPRFTFHGFRYVEVSGYPGRPTADAVTGIVLHSDTAPTGEFECSDPHINQLQHNIQWGQKGNFLEVPTDCPQRDERLGWTGDAQVFIRTAAFNMNVAPFFTKWLRDLEDSQSERGAYPPVSPNVGLGPDGGPAWADAGVICPWTIYQCYGDTRILEEQYSSMTRFMDFLIESAPNLVRCDPASQGWTAFGDWLSINAETPNEVIGTAFLAYSAGLMAGIAGAIGNLEDVERCRKLSDDVRRVFIHRFVTPYGLVAAHTQTAYVLALHFGLLPEEDRASAVDALVRDIQRRGMHLSTGFVGSPYLAHVLSSNGRLDVAYELLHQKSWPSWLYSVTKGATTIWERWDGWTDEKGFQDPGMNSFNHYAYGAIGAWLYAVVGGIDIGAPGYKRIVMRPQPGGGLTSARAALRSVYGRIESDWRIVDGAFEWSITVPPNSSATVYVPCAQSAEITESGRPVQESGSVHFVTRDAEAAAFEVGAGSYRFRAMQVP